MTGSGIYDLRSAAGCVEYFYPAEEEEEEGEENVEEEEVEEVEEVEVEEEHLATLQAAGNVATEVRVVFHYTHLPPQIHPLERQFNLPLLLPLLLHPLLLFK